MLVTKPCSTRYAVLGALVAAACGTRAPARSPTAQASDSVNAAVEPRWMSCEYTFEGSSKTVRVAPTSDVYGVPDVVVGAPFALKFVYGTTPREVATFRVYAYSTGEQKRALIHEANYAAPFTLGGRFGFTGLASVYDPFGEELTYSCAALP